MQVREKKEKIKKKEKDWRNKYTKKPVTSAENGCCGKATSFLTIPIDLN